jgi:arylsulfatase A-like enzyme
MAHFKATHEPFDYPARYDSLYADIEIPEPASLYDFSPETNGRTWLGQKLWILGQRYVEDSERVANGEQPRYPGMPFSLEGLDSLQARKKMYQKFVKDFMRSGAAIDDNIGKLLDYLDEAGLDENTVVIYTADQGYFLGEHGMFDKRMMYEEALCMPFVMRYPPEIPAGTRNDDIILNLDFPSLFADYAGIAEQPDFLQGRSFRDNVRGQTPSDWRTQMYYRYWLHQTNRP